MRKFILTALLLAGCGTKAPMTLPEKYEAAVVIDNNFAETFWLEWKQTGAQLQGTYRYIPSNRKIPQFTGEAKATTGGDKLQLTLTVPADAQKSMGYPPELKCDMKITQKSVNTFQIGGFLDFKVGDHAMHRLLTMTSTEGPPASPK